MVSIRRHPLNLKPSDDSFFAHEFERQIPDPNTLHYDQAIITPDAVIISKNGVEEKSLYAPNHKIFFIGIYQFYYTVIARLLGTTKGSFLLAFDAWSAGYFHWMTEFVPRLFLNRNLLDHKTIILPSINNSIWNKASAIRSLYRNGQIIPEKGYFTESLEAFNIKLKYKHKRRIPLKVKDLDVPTHLAISGNYNDSVMRDLREFYYGFYNIKTANPQRLVYVSRKLATRRYIENEDQVIERLGAMGFEIHTLESLTFQQQILLMAETKFLVAQHGAALTNLLFMQNDSHVLELKSKGDSQNLCYFSLASSMNVNYLYQFCNNDGKSVQDANIVVDLQELDNNVKLII